ncbi:30S ribosomal protein S16 [Candidatus Roizmanbacteria bacterium RIFOXYB2_FULL_38_10]|uniref:Small ribosomal subunit protein bS16 n=1 Tax=Candidatus Roizmanbacteria bacterium RIFOXYD1_FULL_38_12 TaxID=1802093 RepID=A0A1F7L0L2_9BACT|nr:MAG: 30S ribosomal protein S16 [Candidatus Roizmanbacteria bacterium RIFOXYA2_FULL_38_14]OGK63655.1 MAG: 30S ribosomal protein S16 [Candidatus Roizmanbacteria bacterium RIFOXYA1_FULL_37_12]OGK65501.1 MAG: 30S ribosomal protein S16 [Candidatus Roizmanbacteria bacterium RIFOXYB1_FULL_40_23]OGK68285.1 MAG: 30S ribosomal protein S16 [Candidatus Roizmanbacteria bacterium RIFOXYB2_FULL_38_10]OGK69906.1 MAG: 30S ribosomal protein S16 [Candidatus Roizmanbacteria bacterium RIFOXYC1_FULL_38_14]OGK723
MPATIRLMRFGKKGYPTYRIVVLDKRKKAVGSYLEKIGTYNPMKNPAELIIDKQLLTKWEQKGAVLSNGMKKILHKS